MLPAVPGAGAQLAAAAAPKGEKAKKPLARLPNAALPSEWHLPSGRGYTQLSFATCQLTKLPTLQEGEGVLKAGPISTMAEEAYSQPADLDVDDVDMPQMLSDDDDAADEPVETEKQAKQTGYRCASMRLGSNHFKVLERRVFEGVTYLASLDLSTNHISRLDLAPDTLPRLKTLSLRNNRLTEIGPLAKLTTLRRLDLSFNQLASLRGVDKLARLRVLLASGNQLSGDLSATSLSGASRLVLVDLSHNQLASLGGAFSGLTHLSTLRLAHNQIPPRALPNLVLAFGSLSLRRLDLYGNPLALDESYPDELLRVQPKLIQLDHVRQPAGELAAGGSGGAVSRRSVAEAIDAVANSALSQHAGKLEQQRKKHEKLLDTLLSQQHAAAAALDEYTSITNAKIAQFKADIAEAKRTGKSEASVDKVLAHRNELLTNERICTERYRGRMADSIAHVREALAKLQET